MICCCTPWEVECGWVRAESATQGGCAVRLTQQSPGDTCAERPGMRAGERPTYSSHVFKVGLQLATTHRPFLVRSTHP